MERATWLVAGGRSDEPGAPLSVPPVLASNFVIGAGPEYSRDDATPTWTALEDLMGGLEGGEAVAFSSGMAAVAAVFDQLPTNAEVVMTTGCYQGVPQLADAGPWITSQLDADDTPGWISAATRADLLWLESPTNPLLVVADLPAICAAERKQGALLAVDNTFATPLIQRPLDLGADVSIQSATKLIGGHSDLLCGVATTRDGTLADSLRTRRKLAGATPGALESFLATRGARTMALRIERSQANARQLSERLNAHEHVELVRYPGFGTVISFDVVGGAAPADRTCRQVEVIRHATSLGGVESTMERRGAVPGQEHLPAGLIRLSVGIEDVDDLWGDLDGALRSAQG